MKKSIFAALYESVQQTKLTEAVTFDSESLGDVYSAGMADVIQSQFGEDENVQVINTANADEISAASINQLANNLRELSSEPRTIDLADGATASVSTLDDADEKSDIVIFHGDNIILADYTLHNFSRYVSDDGSVVTEDHDANDDEDTVFLSDDQYLNKLNVTGNDYELVTYNKILGTTSRVYLSSDTINKIKEGHDKLKANQEIVTEGSNSYAVEVVASKAQLAQDVFNDGYRDNGTMESTNEFVFADKDHAASFTDELLEQGIEQYEISIGDDILEILDL